MNELVESMGIAMAIAFTVALGGIGIWFLIDKNARKKLVEKEKKKILTINAWFSIVFGILLIVQGSAMIAIFAPSLATSNFSMLMSGIGMFLIIAGALMEVYTHENFKK